MLWRVHCTVTALLLVLISACGVYIEDSRNVEPVTLPPIPLKAPDSLLGSWKHCTMHTDNSVSGAIYTFSAGGVLTFKSVMHSLPGCLDQGAVTLVMKGRYEVGSGNTLDMTLGETGKPGTSTVYRVYWVKGNGMKISNNAEVGGDKNNRDLDLSRNPLILTRMIED